MSLGRFSSAFCIVLATLLAKLSHTTHASQEGIENKNILSTGELRQLLQLLDAEEASKEVQFPPDHLLQLGDLLLEDDDVGTSTTTTSTTTTTTTTTMAPTTTVTPSSTTPSPPKLNHTPRRPSESELVQQLSLFNSLLQSLSQETTEGPTSFPLKEEQKALLQKLFGEVPNSIDTFSRRNSDDAPTSTPPPILPATTTMAPSSISSPDLASLSQLLSQIANSSDATLNDKLGHLKNFQNVNSPMDPASSNQLSNLLVALGTLGTLSQGVQGGQQQQANPLLNFGGLGLQNSNQNYLTSLMQTQASQQPPNIFGNLFQPQPQPQPNQLNFGNLITPGLGLLSTMSNIFGGDGGKPRVRGTGVDTRLGLGYRFGDAADAQIMFDIGPQLFTDPLQNEQRYTMSKKKRQDSSPPTLQSQAIQEKERQQLAASRRYFSVRTPAPPPQILSNRNYWINPTVTKKPSLSLSQHLTPYAQEAALKELWQLIELQELQKRQYPQFQHLSPAELLQASRHKQIFKRASASTPIKPHVPLPNQSNFDKIPVFRKMPVMGSPQTPHISSRNPPGLVNLNIFGMYKDHGLMKKPPLSVPPQVRHPIVHNQGAPSQMSRWDMAEMDKHRFDHFTNTNGELIMTDTNQKDRFQARNGIFRNTEGV